MKAITAYSHLTVFDVTMFTFYYEVEIHMRFKKIYSHEETAKLFSAWLCAILVSHQECMRNSVPQQSYQHLVLSLVFMLAILTSDISLF